MSETDARLKPLRIQTLLDVGRRPIKHLRGSPVKRGNEIIEEWGVTKNRGVGRVEIKLSTASTSLDKKA